MSRLSLDDGQIVLVYQQGQHRWTYDSSEQCTALALPVGSRNGRWPVNPAGAPERFASDLPLPQQCRWQAGAVEVSNVDGNLMTSSLSSSA